MATQDALRIRPEELHARIAQGEAVVVLDVRTEDALSVHPYQIPGSRWLPLASVVAQAHTLPRQSTIVCY
jgi:rhodanese-related sulfurtransferase